jgi:hypothetical protein
MSVSPSLLGTEIATALGQSSATSQVIGFATGILNELTQSGMAAFGSPSGNTISGMTGADMASKVAAAAGFGSVSGTLSGFCSGIVSHIQSAGMVSYTGPTPPATPVYFLGGTISGLSGSAMAAQVQASAGYPSVSSQLLGMCTVIANHIMTNAQVTSGIIS